jgi:negative regulator of flagellin synthesis FlgM
MYIHGTSHVHAAQPLNPPHRMTPAAEPCSPRGAGTIDQLDISPEADFVAQARELPEIREDRVASIRAQIAAGTYETPEKLDAALSRLIDEIA